MIRLRKRRWIHFIIVFERRSTIKATCRLTCACRIGWNAKLARMDNEKQRRGQPTLLETNRTRQGPSSLQPETRAPHCRPHLDKEGLHRPSNAAGYFLAPSDIPQPCYTTHGCPSPLSHRCSLTPL